MYVGAFLRVYPLHLRILLLLLFLQEKAEGVNWMEKASFKKIQRLLEISKWERHHEILLTAKNLHELNISPSSYIIPIIPLPLPAEIVEGEHYVIADLLNLVLGSSSSAKNFETEAVSRELVISTQFRQPSSAKE